MTKELLQQCLGALRAFDDGANRHGMGWQKPLIQRIEQALAQQEQPASVDAYNGAREDVAIWKKRALEAEELNRKFIAEVNGPTYLGEPVKQEQPSVHLRNGGEADDLAPEPMCTVTYFDTSHYVADNLGIQHAKLAHHCRMLEAKLAQQEQPASISYIPVDAKLRDKNYNHPNDKEPCTDDCRRELNRRGDDSGQGLDGFWKWGFKAGFNAAKVQQEQPSMPTEEDFCYCNKNVSLQIVSGGGAPEGYLGKVTLRIGDQYRDYYTHPPTQPALSELFAAMHEAQHADAEVWKDMCTRAAAQGIRELPISDKHAKSFNKAQRVRDLFTAYKEAHCRGGADK